jgi:hypothetical protein
MTSGAQWRSRLRTRSADRTTALAFSPCLNRAVTRGTPGTTFHNVFEEEEYDPSKHAVERHGVLNEIIYTSIADAYR